jgi:protocatechuate 3,4-dioxygenase beta subunit
LPLKRNLKEYRMNNDDRQGWIVSRREMLALLGAAAANMLIGCSFRQSGGAGSDAASLSCVATPEQTEGPYFVDERLHRSDIRVDPSDGSMKEGLPLTLEIHVSSSSRGGCKPLAGASVDIWHCDAQGVYSDATDPRFRTIGKKFLRGYQVTDANGSVEFRTIYPGWYEGRTVHIHFKVRTAPKSARAYEFTSQFYFEDSITDRVHAQRPYVKKGQRTLKNEGDGIFRDGGSQLVLSLVENAQGYAARFDVGLQMA